MYSISNSAESKYLALYELIKQKIMDGFLTEGDKLPSVREMVLLSNVSKTTVESAYEQLKEEGYIKSKNKSGYYVEKITALNVSHPIKDYKVEPIKQYRNTGMTHNLFPFNMWYKSLSKVIHYRQDELLKRNDPMGELCLRKQLADFLRGERGTYCSPEQILIGAGTQSLLRVVLTLFESDSKVIAYQGDGFLFANYLFKDYSFCCKRIPSKNDLLDVSVLTKIDPCFVYVFPSYQYPYGSGMTIDTRIRLLNWAKLHNKSIFEDDFNSILSYEHKPYPSLQSLSKGEHVFYFGSFSKLFLPGMRLSYVIIPPNYLSAINKIIHRYPQGVSKFDQLALSDFMETGGFNRHIRKLKKAYQEKNNIVRQTLAEIINPNYQFLGLNGGVNFVVKSTQPKALKSICERAEKIDLLVLPIEGRKDMLSITYSGLENIEIINALQYLFA